MARARDTAALSTSVLPSTFRAGDIIWSSRAAPPSGWLACDGAAVSRTTYAALFVAIGTTHGAGDGTTTFNLPDLRGRSAVGAGTGTGLSARTLGATGGTETHVLDATEMPPHTHATTFKFNNNISGSGSRQGLMNPADTPNAGDYVATSASAGSGAAHNNMPPFAVLSAFVYSGV